jgi:hypothetical protein
MKEELEKMIAYLPKLTKHEADFIEHILKWTDAQRAAFRLAKRIFEDEME